MGSKRKLEWQSSYQKTYTLKQEYYKPQGRTVHYIMIKGSIQEEDITVANKYAPNIINTSIQRQAPFQKIRYTKAIFHATMSSMKDRNGRT